MLWSLINQHDIEKQSSDGEGRRLWVVHPLTLMMLVNLWPCCLLALAVMRFLSGTSLQTGPNKFKCACAPLAQWPSFDMELCGAGRLGP